jgi:hypothetical protein
MEIAILAAVELCPQIRDVIAPRCVDIVCIGDLEVSGENDSTEDSAHT